MDNRGFTLVEMAIVLVIIGLLVGGVLVGRDLITQAETRAQITQIEKYNQAVNTFRGKYGGLPGDLLLSRAAAFGFLTGNCSGMSGARDGNGLVYSLGSAPSVNQLIGETYLFWEDLGASGLIEGTYPVSGAAPLTCAAPTPTLTLAGGAAYVGNYFPAAKVGQGNFLYVYAIGSYNWYGLSAITATDAGADMFSSAKLIVVQAYNIDQKIDDGIPNTGNVITTYVNGSATTNPLSGVSDTIATCSNTGSTSSAYSISTAANGGSGANCALSFRFQ